MSQRRRAADDTDMDITASTSVTVLPSTGGRRRWFAKQPASPVVPDPAPTSDVTVLETTPVLPEGEHPQPASDFAPLAAFGRWMADFDGTGPVSAVPISAVPVSVGPVSTPAVVPARALATVALTLPAAAPLTAYSTSVTTEPAPVTVHTVAPTYEPSAARPDESAKIAELTRDLHELTEELETIRQRNAAERMNLLEQLASARDARRSAETELAAVQAILDAAERRLPAPRRSQLHAVS